MPSELSDAEVEVRFSDLSLKCASCEFQRLPATVISSTAFTGAGYYNESSVGEALWNGYSCPHCVSRQLLQNPKFSAEPLPLMPFKQYMAPT